MTPILDEISVIAAVNRDEVLKRDLLASPMLSVSGVERFFFTGARNIGEAYRAGVERTKGEYMIFAHQDVYFPQDWHLGLEKAIQTLADSGKNWAVLGCFGISAQGIRAGRVWSSGLNQQLNPNFSSPFRACCLDELVLVVRRSSGVCFDPDLPHFHLYGTDIVQAAQARGYASFVIDAPVIHNSDQLRRLGKGYRQAYDYMRKKWEAELPIRTLIGQISWDEKGMRRANRNVIRRYIRALISLKSRPNRGVDDPAALAKCLGYQ